jgi:signal transduction histidine kinase
MDRLERWLTPRTPLARHALAALFVAVAFVLTVLLRTVTPRFHFILFVPAVMFAAWFGGRAAGLTASALTVVLAAAFLLPGGAFIEELAWLIVAAIVVVGTSALTAAHRRAEARLAALLSQESARRREAESLSQLKSDVLAQIAHELRQPLGAITSAAQVLEKAPTDASRERGLGVITRQTEHLRRLVDDLLDASRLQRRELKLQTSDVDLCEVVEDVRHVIAPAVTERRIELSSSIPACPLIVRADATRVRQILSNLLSNAVKYTGHGGRIDLVLEETKGDDGGVVIRVRDTGRGIPPERLTQIFEMFQTGHGEGTGLGVGLAIVKGLAEMHGGSVQATSDGPGRGSEFIVRLPAGAERPAA